MHEPLRLVNRDRDGFLEEDRHDVVPALVGLVVVLWMVLHGVTATPVMQRIDELRSEP